MRLSELADEVAEEYCRWHTKTSSMAVPNWRPDPTRAREYIEALERVLDRKQPATITIRGVILNEDDPQE